ncbi:DNA-binding protein [Microvirga sp. STR05]|uniref:DNA-binding protein n=1 Tax=Hymenobacter duratus TaxID=2771356 RepID=A0ABR8JFF6_9BACT|nr:DNA-binding protein [Hymenobacter duratus]MBD2714107.1 DNA-binding protein [Hymenobacter duratus]MBR7949009.1 DNA-binding protein [Microvirga sp. STR05]
MQIDPEEIRSSGNLALLRQRKTAFFCSREYPAEIERLTYLWALEQRYMQRCIISGFHSKLEQTVFRYLLQGSRQPIVYTLGRGIQANVRLEYGPEIEAGRLLFLSPFESTVRTITSDTAEIRNLLIADLADEFFIPYLQPGGNLDQLLAHPIAQGKPVYTLNIALNRPLLKRGIRPWLPMGVLGRHTAPQAARR